MAAVEFIEVSPVPPPPLSLLIIRTLRVSGVQLLPLLEASLALNLVENNPAALYMVDCVELGCENIRPMFARAVESVKTEGFRFSCYRGVQYTSELSVAMWCCGAVVLCSVDYRHCSRDSVMYSPTNVE